MPKWDYSPTPPTKQTYNLIPEGDCRVCIQDVQAKTFKSGNEGFSITLEVAGEKSRLFHNLVLNTNDPERTNKNLKDFFESFSIADTNMETGTQWIGADGGARIAHEEWNGETRAKVKYFLSRHKVDRLEPWPDEQAATPLIADADDDDLPF